MQSVRVSGVPLTSPPWLVNRMRAMFTLRRSLFSQARALGEQRRELNLRISKLIREHAPFAREVERLGDAAPNTMRDEEQRLRELLAREREDDARMEAEVARLSRLAGDADHQAVELLKVCPDAAAIDNEVRA